MTDRAELHKLLDQLADDVLPAVAEYLEAVSMGCPPDAPHEDEELSPEEQAMIDASRASIARGEAPIRHEELEARMAAHRERA